MGKYFLGWLLGVPVVVLVVVYLIFHRAAPSHVPSSNRVPRGLSRRYEDVTLRSRRLQSPAQCAAGLTQEYVYL
jgi:hypothetical protein